MVKKTFYDFGIQVPADAEGETRVICPRCSPGRKAAHQNERDLSVNVDEGTWFCHHCGWSGGLMQGQESKPTYQSHQYTPTNLPQKVLSYFANRGISGKTLSECGVGYQEPKGKAPGAVMFPRYKGGQVVAIKYRTHDKRMWQSKDPEPCFYNYDRALESGSDNLIITEGEIDTLSLIEAGLKNVASVPDGAPPATAKNLDGKFKFLDDGLVDHFEHFILAVDNDEPGKALEEHLAERLGRHRCSRITYPIDCKDANDVLIQYGHKRLQEIIEQATPYPIDGLFSIVDVQDAVLDLYNAGLKPGLSTGWDSVDKHYTVRPCEMTIITGIPGSGKSTWLDALTVNLHLFHGWKFAFCSPENWPIQRHIAGIAEKLARKPFASHTFTSQRMTKEELQEALRFMDQSFFFTQLQDQDMNIDGVLNVMQAAISRYGVKGVILDPWNELEYHRPANLSETEFVSESLGKIRRFARMNDAHVWIVAHPTKLKRRDDGTYPVPRLYDISGSAHFYNKADNGISIYRADPRKNEVEIHIQKIRFREVGKLGKVDLKFSKDCGVFLEVDGEEGEQPKPEACNRSTPF